MVKVDNALRAYGWTQGTLGVWSSPNPTMKQTINTNGAIAVHKPDGKLFDKIPITAKGTDQMNFLSHYTNVTIQ